jgi:hypothetical protein
MAKPKRGLEDIVPSFPATPAYKQWVWEEIRRRKWTQQRFVDEMKRADRILSGGILTKTSSTGWLTQFLGAEDAARRFHTNTELMPAMNRALGIAQPSVCDPASPLSQLKDRLDHLWRVMTPAERERFLRSMEAVFALVERDDSTNSR